MLSTIKQGNHCLHIFSARRETGVLSAVHKNFVDVRINLTRIEPPPSGDDRGNRCGDGSGRGPRKNNRSCPHL